MQVNDFSYLSPEEAREKVRYIISRVYAEQFHSRFVKDIRSDVYLRNEIHAYLQGWIPEMHGWNDVLGQIWDAISQPLSDFMNWFWNNVIKPGVNTIVSGFKWLWDAAKSAAENAYNTAKDIFTKVASIYSYITEKIWNTLNTVWDSLKNIGSTIWNNLQSYLSYIRNAVISIWDKYIKPGISAIVSAYKGLWDAALNVAKSAWNGIVSVGNTLKSAWDSILKDFHSFGEKLWGWIKALPNALGSAFEAAMGVLKDIAQWIWDHVLVPAGQAIANGLKWVFDKIGNLLWQGFSGLYNAILSLGRMDPLRAKDNFPMIMKIALGAGVGLGGATLLGELMHPLKNLGLGRIGAMLWKATNYDIVTGAIVGALAYAAFRKPLTYAFHEHFRPELPDLRNTVELMSRRKISRELYQFPYY